MKKLFLFFVMIAILAFVGFVPEVRGADANQMFYVSIVQPSTNDVASTPVDVSAYKGNAAFVIALGPGAAGYTNTVTLSHATASDGSYATITNLAGTSGSVVTVVGTNEYTVVTYPCDLARLHKYVKATVSKNGGNTACTSVLLVSPYKSQ